MLHRRKELYGGRGLDSRFEKDSQYSDQASTNISKTDTQENDEIVFVIQKNGDIKTLYTEKFDLDALGITKSKRASDVEHELIDGEYFWVARLCQEVELETGEYYPSGTIIAKHKKRSKTIEKEISWLSEILFKVI